LNLLLLPGTPAATGVVNLQGAGTSNPSKFFWDRMGTIEDRAKIPVNLGYRAVGSSTGYKEFTGIDLGSSPYPNADPYVAKNHFGSGDIPIPGSYYDALQQNSNRSIMQLPFVAGGIAIFYNDDGGNIPQLQLTACVLAKIFDGQITTWDHADIQALNTAATLPTTDITVVHRALGSSSTAGTTEYLVKTTTEYNCQDSWTLGSGSTVSWPSGMSHRAAEGSGGVTAAILETPGAIGYLDSGHGYDAGFAEIALQNEDGVFLRANEANIGIATEIAITNNVFPTDPTATWEDVNLYNLPGATTWPITMVSYFYLDQDWSTMDGEVAGLLMYFLKSCLSTDGQALASSSYGFSEVPQSLINFDLAALATITLPTDYKEFTEEASTQIIQGAGDYVISVKRKTAHSLSLGGLEGELESLGVDTLAQELASLEARLASVETDMENRETVSAARLAIHAPQFDIQSTLSLVAGLSALWIALRG